jgi:hypothetical protein
MLNFSEVEFDLGDVQYQSIVDREIVVTNNSVDKVILTPSFSSCKCTTGSVTKTELQPLESGIFTITFNSTEAGAGSGQVKWIDLNYQFNGSDDLLNKVIKFKVNVIN